MPGMNQNGSFWPTPLAKARAAVRRSPVLRAWLVFNGVAIAAAAAVYGYLYLALGRLAEEGGPVAAFQAQQMQWSLLFLTIGVFAAFSALSFAGMRCLASRLTKAEPASPKAAADGNGNPARKSHPQALPLHLHAIMEMMAGKDSQSLDEYRDEIHQFDRLAMMGELLNGLAHEIRNPVAGISAAIQTLSRRVPESDPSYEIYRNIRQTSDRLDHLIRSLLSFARTGKPHFRPTAVNEAIGESLSVFESKPGRYGKIVKTLEDGLPPVCADPKLLQQVLYNLFINAYEAKPNGLELEISSHFITRKVVGDFNVVSGGTQNPFRCDKGVIQIRVSDNGPGIPGGDAMKIFKPFYTTKEKGTGFGLYFSMQIVRQHHGCLFARNNPGGGASFVICLPVMNETACLPGVTEKPQEALESNRKG